MNALYSIISKYPEAIAALFAVINGLWLAFTYFNGQRHARELENLRHSLHLDAERRKKVFELKVNQYEAYVTSLDAFGKKHQVDLPARMQPVFEEYFAGYMAAAEAQDKEQEREVIARFSSKISSFMREGLEDYMRLQSETSRLKLTASDALLTAFEALEAAMEQAHQKSNEFMSRFTDLVLRQDFEAMAALQRELEVHGSAVKDKSRALMARMREDLAEI